MSSDQLLTVGEVLPGSLLRSKCRVYGQKQPEVDGLVVASYGCAPLVSALMPRDAGDPALVAGLVRLRAPIGRLFRDSSPAAVVRSIGTVVVDAINRVVGTWPRSHIRVKRLERVDPACADSNASTTIVGVPLVIGAQASVFHARPNAELARLRHSVRSARVSMHSLPLLKTRCSKFIPKTSAATGVSSAQRGGVNYSDGPTLASAFVSALTPRAPWCFAEHRPSAESATNIIHVSHSSHLCCVIGWPNRLSVFGRPQFYLQSETG